MKITLLGDPILDHHLYCGTRATPDSARGHEWLQHLLAPMQDGTFQEGQITHPIGKCVFIFAGGTADRFDDFGVNEPAEMPPVERRKLPGCEYTERREDEKAWLACPDLTWPIRRALMLRSVLGLKDNPKIADVLDMDRGLLYALLSVPHYRHGSRSFEKILLTLANDGDRTGPLPPFRRTRSSTGRLRPQNPNPT